MTVADRTYAERMSDSLLDRVARLPFVIPGDPAWAPLSVLLALALLAGGGLLARWFSLRARLRALAPEEAPLAEALAEAHARASEPEERIRREQPEIADVIVHTEP